MTIFFVALWRIIPSSVKTTFFGILIAIAAYFGFKIWLVNHDANIRHSALKGYVQQSQLDTAKAKLAEMMRQKNVAETALSDFQKQRLSDQRAESAQKAQEDEKYEKELKDSGRAWILEQSDIDHLLR